jgi:hypothetical protein
MDSIDVTDYYQQNPFGPPSLIFMALEEGVPGFCGSIFASSENSDPEKRPRIIWKPARL